MGQEPDRQQTEQPHDRDGDGQHYIDRSKIDFDPDESLYSGTAVEGTTEIPSPRERDEEPRHGSEQQA